MINLFWGCGSFLLYWFDHFFYQRIFTNQDYIFIASMAGITTIAAIRSKKLDSIKDDSDASAPVKPE